MAGLDFCLLTFEPLRSFMKAEEWLSSGAIVAAFLLQEALACFTDPTQWLQGGLRISFDLLVHLHNFMMTSMLLPESSGSGRRDSELPVETFISQAPSVCLVLVATPPLYKS